MTKEGNSRPTLLRTLKQWDLTAIGVNQVIGAGIFVLPASVAALVGQAASPLVWIVAAAVNVLIIICFAEAGSRFRDAGGPYLYAKAAFGPFVGLEVAWMMWLTRVASQAALANAFVLYLAYFWDGATEGIGRVVILTVLLSILAAINYRGVRHGSWTINFFTVGKLVPLAIFILFGIWHIDWGHFREVLEPELGGFGPAILLLIYAFGGLELITYPAGEAVSPAKEVPRALLSTIIICSCFYIVVQVIAVGTLKGLGQSEAPLADAAATFLGPVTGILIALGALVSIAGANAGTMLAGPRLTYALAEQKQLPSFFGLLHPRYRTPHASIGFYYVVSLVLALTGSFVQMAVISSVARLIFYTTTCCAVPILRKREDQPPSTFTAPGGLIFPILATVASLAIIAGADYQSLSAGGLVLAVGAVIYGIQRLFAR